MSFVDEYDEINKRLNELKGKPIDNIDSIYNALIDAPYDALNRAVWIDGKWLNPQSD